jgi:hypothetical protein
VTFRAEAERLSDSKRLAPRLAAALNGALDSGIGTAVGGTADRDIRDLADAAPADRRDRFETLLQIYDLHIAPLERIGAAARLQHHPALAALKQRCEAGWLLELEPTPIPDGLDLKNGIIPTMRALAARDRLPTIYRWLATTATWEQVVEFLALEGGPDAGFDDLVAACQVGLAGSAKMELAVNYWDEMGNGDLAAVHTQLHDDLVTAIDMPAVPLTEQSDAALERLAFGGLLATNRWLQPEMLGALGLIELQAGPRCRLVVQAFDRTGAPAGAYPFYEVHADVDPRHGKDWLEKAIAPLVALHPELAPRILRGAVWRDSVNSAFLDDLAVQLGVVPPAAAPAA